MDPEYPWNGRKSAFVLTTDDGNDDNGDWIPVFEAVGLRYSLMVNANTIGTGPKLSVAELQAAAASGFEIGNHGLDHILLPGLSDGDLATQIDKAALEALIGDGYEVKTFCYPQHDHDNRVMAALQDAGYLGARGGAFSQPENLGKYTNKLVHLRPPNIYNRFEMETSNSMVNITGGNTKSEGDTRTFVQDMLASAKTKHYLQVAIAHFTTDVDAAHMGYILDELVNDPDVWVTTLRDALQYLRFWTGPGIAEVP